MSRAAQLADLLAQRVFVPLEASGRHVHLTQQAAQVLFGGELTPKRPLSQPGQFLSCQRVTLVGPKGELAHVAVLGPARPQCQVELSFTDCVALGIQAPVRQSGDVAHTPGITLRTERGELTLAEGVIVAQRHIHLTPQSAALRGLADGQVVQLACLTGRPLIFGDVVVRVSPQFADAAHIDFDEANACGFAPGDLALPRGKEAPHVRA